MANADEVKALLESHADGDDARFYSIALQVAAGAARSGQSQLAQDLRDLVGELRKDAHHAPGRSKPVPVAQPHGALAELLSVSYPTARTADLVLDARARERLERVVVEHQQHDRLRAQGFRPLRRVLLLGPPGTGKTLSASALAGELQLPLFVIRLDGLITKFMGETAAKLRLVFDALTETPGVYLFDEVDALGGERSRHNDVGEIRRVLNSFLQFLEQDQSESLLVAATNHPRLLDDAMFGRFDSVIQYPLPTPAVARELIRKRLANVRLGIVAWPQIDGATARLSHAEITLAAERAAKDAILSNEQHVGTARLVAALRERHSRPDA
jgi:SpoVK/Ycf46/Vps4 family AAA+-type ATPase